MHAPAGTGGFTECPIMSDCDRRFAYPKTQRNRFWTVRMNLVSLNFCVQIGTPKCKLAGRTIYIRGSVVNTLSLLDGAYQFIAFAWHGR
jgi:hypothetical protein